eukprot:scaffold48_cov122-Skeletonema_menzelii.AAC.5
MSTGADPAAVDDSAPPESETVAVEVHDGPQVEPADAADDESKIKNLEQPDDDTKGAPQAKLPENESNMAAAATTTTNMAAPLSPGDESEGEFEDCKISPLDADRQRRSLKSALLSDEPETTTIEEGTNHQSSLLHEDEYSQSLKQPHHPNNHESALANSSGGGTKKKGIFGLSGPPFRSNKSKPTRQRLGGLKQGHSHPRKSPYRSEVARLRHEQQQARKKHQQTDGDDSQSTASSKTISLSSTNAPPDSADFWKQSAKFKHMLLTSVGDFLTSAFADDEETSASYFSQELLEQLSENDPTITGVWLQSKNLSDGDIKVLCDNLMRNTMVTEVWLPGNFITDEGAKYIAHMLKFNKSIKELFLGQNDIGPRGAAALAAALARGNSTLVALGLGENRVGVEGAGAFAAALRHNHVLRTLDLKRNGIPKSSSIRALLSKMLEFNASDPGDESLVLGLQEELVGLIQNLPEDVASDVVMKAEDALKTAMLCRRKGDIVGAAEAEGLFIRICTTGAAPIDPPEETAGGGRMMGGGKGVDAPDARSSGRSRKAKRSSNPTEPDRLDEINEELSALQFVEGSKDANSDENHFNDEEIDSKVASVEEEDGKDVVDFEVVDKGEGEEGTADSDKKETSNVSTTDEEGGDEGTAEEESPET